MKNRTYTPQPIDTRNVEVPRYLLDLADTLARNVHDTWAQERIRQGWQYGPERNDTKKLHPCLVPFEELSDDEKKYDYNTAMETIKVILGMGYKIEIK
jgi:hypothetical protein